MYRVIAINNQGASDVCKCDSAAEIWDYVDSWSDPETMRFEVEDDGQRVAYKPRGRTADNFFRLDGARGDTDEPYTF